MKILKIVQFVLTLILIFFFYVILSNMQTIKDVGWLIAISATIIYNHISATHKNC